MRLMKFNSRAEYVPGKEMTVADALSRNPLKHSDVPDKEVDVLAHVNLVISSAPATDERLEEIRRATAEDSQMKESVK